ncbi:MAG TPA: hypothetical protein VH370_10170 [Humisphaera sp.]|jgi:hypothetical protein|nr:hypothetical protein [Humisphaera sp.]
MMEATETEFEHTPKLRTPFVLALVALADFTFSFLATFAIPQALISSNVIRPWPAGHDPRLRWLAISFVAIMVLFIAVAVVWRQLSSRQMRTIDAMIDAEEVRDNVE